MRGNDTTRCAECGNPVTNEELSDEVELPASRELLERAQRVLAAMRDTDEVRAARVTVRNALARLAFHDAAGHCLFCAVEHDEREDERRKIDDERARVVRVERDTVVRECVVCDRDIAKGAPSVILPRGRTACAQCASAIARALDREFAA